MIPKETLIAVIVALFAAVGVTFWVSSEADQTTRATSPEFGFTGALDGNCSHGGRNQNGVEVFLSMCPRSSRSPDGRWLFVNAGETSNDDEGNFPDYVFIEDSTGTRVGPVPGLSDAMPFAVFWSPRPNWLFVDHHAGSFMQTPEVFEITSTGVVKHDIFILRGQEEARKQFPCLPNLNRAWVNGNVLGWSADGRRIAWSLMTRIDVCMGPKEYGPVPKAKQVFPMVMVSDIETGEVVAGSVIVLDSDSELDFEFPKTEPYRNILKP